MSRAVDAEDQKAHIAAAVWRLVARGGLEAVSMRVVAAEAGVSLGRVQRYFLTKDELLLHSLQHAYQRMEARTEQRLAGTAGSDRQVLAAVLEEMLGEDLETREAIRINLAYAARALADERVAAVLTAGDEAILALATAVIAQARHDGHVGPEVDPQEEAHVLFALASGLGTGVALYGASPAAARATLEYHLRRVVPLGSVATSPDQSA